MKVLLQKPARTTLSHMIITLAVDIAGSRLGADAASGAVLEIDMNNDINLAFKLNASEPGLGYWYFTA